MYRELFNAMLGSSLCVYTSAVKNNALTQLIQLQV